jgi:glucan-binding YG repeat protein
MYVNQWFKGFADDEEQDDPEDDGEHWYYFGSRGKKITSDKKKIGGKTYFFNADGQMHWGWYSEGDDVYYLGTEDEGWRAEGQWLWLEKPSLAYDADNDGEFNHVEAFSCGEDDACDDEGWYWFQSSGKMYYGNKKKKINGNFFIFNEHGQMLYEWINGAEVSLGSNAKLDGHLTTEGTATIGDMLWFRENGSDSIDGSRPTGWFQIDGSEDVGSQDDTKWYYIKKGVAKHADATDTMGIMDGKDQVFVKREKIDGKYFAFNEKGEMQDGLQFINNAMYYFNSDGYQQTGKQSNVEEDDDNTYSYYFTTKNAGNGKGYTGEKDGYLYWMGKRLEADDDYKVYLVEGDYYLVNTKGKCQKSDSKRYDIETPDGTVEDLHIKTESKKSYKLKWVEKQTLSKISCVPYITLCDSMVVENIDGNAETKTKVGPAKSYDWMTETDAKAFKTKKAADDDEEE